jgi:chaperonin GroEL (HSP60 family)
MDAIDVVIELKNAHTGKKTGKVYGVNVLENKVSDMMAAHVIEPLRVKTQAIQSATEVASMILRIDDIIASKRTPPPTGGPPGGSGGMGGMPPGMM